ncbi:MAG: hypothetical protein AAFZ65_14330, partial [Planctomycetota bacterium]
MARLAALITTLLLTATSLTLAGCLHRGLAAEQPDGLPWTLREGTWRTDPAWYDGQAECARYAAKRVIYGQVREYEARAYTNKQQMDAGTTTKASGSSGVEVFKHHWSERAPTERYDYDFSTAVFSRADDLSTFKYTASTQEDCGASFKQAWEDDDGWRALESVYFPDGGTRSLEVDGALPLPHDALTLVLRDLASTVATAELVPLPDMRLSVLPSQRDTHRVSWEPETLIVKHYGSGTLAVPFGEFECHKFRLEDEAGNQR